MSNSFVLDTSVLIFGCTGDDDSSLECHWIIHKVFDGILHLGVDSEGEILDEYVDVLHSHAKLPLAKFFQKLIIKEKYCALGSARRIISYIPISERKVKGLLKMGFHGDDLKFVRIAPKTDLQMICSTDNKSFLNTDYSSWINTNLDVKIQSPSEFIEFISSISSI